MEQERLDRKALDDKARTSAPRERVGSKPGPGKGPGAADVRTNDFALKLGELHDEFTVLSDEAEANQKPELEDYLQAGKHHVK